MKAALMWMINDFPAYGMLSGWMTQGKLACPICMEDTKAFTLKHGGKNSWFDCHRRFLDMEHPYRRQAYKFKKATVENEDLPARLNGHQVWDRVKHLPKITEVGKSIRFPGYGMTHNWTKQSIFWELSYWKDNLVRHCLDVMHVEKNVFDNIMNIVMDTDQTKDNVKARQDLEEYCRRHELRLQQLADGRWSKPKASYTLTLPQRQDVCKWVKELKMPDNYASNLSRCVNVEQGRFFGMKSHDCHIFMECLLPAAFRELPDHVWKPLTELSEYFRDLCSPTLRVEDLLVMEKNIPVILCKLERILPPGFFDSMEHLPIHLAYEARVCGPVQYRWMYPFEREIGGFKRTVKNRAQVEGSICQAYISRETSNFCTYYFEPHVQSRRTRVGRNDDRGESSNEPSLSIFNQPGRVSGKCEERWILGDESEAAHLHILLNCDEVRDPINGITDPDLYNLSRGPKNKAYCWPIYFVNGYKFQTIESCQGRKTDNSGVSVRENSSDGDCDWYGKLHEIVELEYAGETIKRIVLFKCEWFDPTRPTVIDTVVPPILSSPLNEIEIIDPPTQVMRYNEMDDIIEDEDEGIMDERSSNDDEGKGKGKKGITQQTDRGNTSSPTAPTSTSTPATVQTSQVRGQEQFIMVPNPGYIAPPPPVQRVSHSAPHTTQATQSPATQGTGDGSTVVPSVSGQQSSQTQASSRSLETLRWDGSTW
ncbi:uncharacterized protein LOC113874279 [Abrus precatorius]|uniref:Uncharacterized protein LOC113874279 n=1 Tax=Abrus precatorius TaxID=3816 RepID=A0A8B8ML31_ABRPR|nr:uncharacterized protein LOC113874279 [Abrus precatorius]